MVTLMTAETATEQEDDFPIVGVGASAGGLEALRDLFEKMPADTGMAFVVVQHLSPDFKSMLDELLSRYTTLPVHQAEHDMEVEPNTIYLMPARHEMIISDRHLILSERDSDKGLFLPIDTFFRSLATDAGASSVAVVLSGTGSDGSRGVRDIHAAGGLVIVQSEASAKFDGMPKSAEKTGVADLVLPPAEIRESLIRYAARARDHADAPPAEKAGDAVSTIFELLRRESGIDFASYKQSTVSRRVDRRLLLSRSRDLEDYVDKLCASPEEVEALYKDLLIGVTGFFRDAEAFRALENAIVPELIDRLRVESQGELRVWVAACATGEEAYSIGIVLHEAFRQRNLRPHMKIFATDVHASSIEIAAQGRYPAEALADMPEHLKQRYFEHIGDEYQVQSQLRGSMVFARHNVLRDAPFTRLDLITCRNLLIYFKTSAQRKVLALFHFSLKIGGALMLGPSETPGPLSDEFTSVDPRWKIYRKRRDIGLPSDLKLARSPLMTSHERPERARVGPPEVGRAQQVLLDRYAPPSLIVDSQLQLVHTFNGGGRYLGPRDGRASLHLLDMLEGELKFAVSGAFKKAVSDGQTVVYSGVPARSVDGLERVKLTLEPLTKEGAERILITFEPMEVRRESERPDTDMEELAQNRIDSLEHELHYAKENLQATIEEMEAGHEELQATNEELIAANEELQSANEELQSVNEELYTVNAEHQAKIAELTELTTDMNHLLTATEVHTIFLDHELRIRKFTPKIAETFNLLPHDIGRRIDTFTHHLRHDGLVADLEAGLDQGKVVERDVRDRQGRWYFLRILPYRPYDHGHGHERGDGQVDGVLLTLVDISTLKRTERELRTSEQRYRTLVRAVESTLWTTDARGDMATEQLEWEAFTGQAWDEYRGRGWLNAIIEAERRTIASEWMRAVSARSLFELETRLWSQASAGYRCVVLRAAPVLDEDQNVREWVGTIRDIEDMARARSRLRERETELAGILDNSPIIIAVKDPEGRYIFASRLAEDILGNSTGKLAGKSDSDLLPASIARELHLHDEQVLHARHAMEFEESLPMGGERRIFSMVRFPLLDDRGEPYALAAVGSDITERKVAEERDRRELARRDQFLAMMSHELRNPLGAIVNAAHLLVDSRSAERAHKVIERQSAHMARLLDDLLDISRISQGKIEIRFSRVNILESAEAAIEMVQPMIRSKCLELRICKPDTAVAVRGDRDRIEQVINNLLRNAAKFTDSGGWIELDIRPTGNRVEIAVRDSGIGLAPGEQDKVFELFYQRDMGIDRASSGLGVGLSLVRELVGLHGGTVRAHSEGHGKGSEFVVSLPAAPPDVSARAAPSTNGGATQQGLRIVLVEDNEDSREMLELLLTARGHEVASAADGAAGAQLIIERRPDLALVDIGLPLMSGYDVARKVRKECGGNAAIYLIALTGYGRQEDRKAVLEAGFDEHLVKPIDITALDQLAGSTRARHPG
jgi:two-component system, chemotaxis family, CheB/CheR fusion protein